MSCRGRRVVILTSSLVGVFVANAGPARGNGAFPDTQAVLLPAGRPELTILASNFGLVLTEDAGAHWQYSCEVGATLNGRLYSLGGPSGERIFSLSDYGVASSGDLGCTWKLGSGPFDGGLVLDYFADPSDATRVWAVAEPPGSAGRLPAELFASHDGGLNFGAALYTAPADGGISGVEIAGSDPAVAYLTVFETDQMDGRTRPRLLRSADRGATFETIDLEPMLGASRVSIASIDPTDASRIFLRVSGTNAEMRSVDSLAVSADGGHSFAKPVNLTGGTLTTFFVRRNGTVLVSGLLGATVVGYRSVDGGVSFASWQSHLHPRGFGERGTTLLVAANDSIDGFALGSSEDNGDSFTPRMRFQEIQAIRGCVYQGCLLDCQQQMSMGLFEPSVCRAGNDAGPAADAGGKSATKATGCGGCSMAPLPGSGPLLAVFAAIALAALRFRRRRVPRGQPVPRIGRQPRSGTFLWLLVAASLPTLLAISRPAFGYVRSKTASGVPYRWATPCISVDVHLGGLPGVSEAQMRSAASEAARTWTTATASCSSLRIVLSFVDGVGPALGNDGINVIGARTDGWCASTTDGSTSAVVPQMCNSPSAAAATSVFAATDGRILGGDTHLNTINFAFATLDDRGQPAGSEDLQSIVTHEIGHLIGLDHPCWSGLGPRATDDRGAPVIDCYGAPEEVVQDTMFPTLDPGDVSRRGLSSEARRAICEIYPLSTATPPTNDKSACPAVGGGGCEVASTPHAGWIVAMSLLAASVWRFRWRGARGPRSRRRTTEIASARPR